MSGAQTAWDQHARRLREIAAAERIYVAKLSTKDDLRRDLSASIPSIPIAYGV